MKTVTAAVLVSSAIATIKGKDSATLFGRRISEDSIKKAIAVTVAFFAICTISTILLLAASNAEALDAVFEAVSATATVGLSRNFTTSLTAFGKLVITVTMYFGRVGVLTISLGFLMGDKAQERYRYANTNLLIG